MDGYTSIHQISSCLCEIDSTMCKIVACTKHTFQHSPLKLLWQKHGIEGPMGSEC